MRLILTILCLVNCGATGWAKSYTARSNDCAAAVADLSQSDELEMSDINPWRDLANDVAPLVDVDLEDAGSDSVVFQRFRIDSTNGNILGPNIVENGC